MKILLPCLTLAVLAGACGQADEPAPEAAAVVAPDSTSPDSVYAAEPARATLPSASIYYTLTDYAWYAEGRPLLHESRGYMPEGTPVSASAETMTKAGEYEGVEYYVQPDIADAVVYVPVYEGYWQAFRAEGG